MEVDENDTRISKIEDMNYIIDYTKIFRMLELIEYKGNIYNTYNFNYQKLCNAYLEDHALLADEEHLDYYAERACEEAS